MSWCWIILDTNHFYNSFRSCHIWPGPYLLQQSQSTLWVDTKFLVKEWHLCFGAMSWKMNVQRLAFIALLLGKPTWITGPNVRWHCSRKRWLFPDLDFYFNELYSNVIIFFVSFLLLLVLCKRHLPFFLFIVCIFLYSFLLCKNREWWANFFLEEFKEAEPGGGEHTCVPATWCSFRLWFIDGLVLISWEFRYIMFALW